MQIQTAPLTAMPATSMLGAKAPQAQQSDLLSHPAYHQARRLGGYKGKVNIFRACTRVDMAKLLMRNNPQWSRTDHADLAEQHARAAAQLEEQWSQFADAAAQQTFGRPFRFEDYRISAIGCEEFSEEMKEKLRYCAYTSGDHKTAAVAHQTAALSLSRKRI